MNFFMRTYIKETMRMNQLSPWFRFYLFAHHGFLYRETEEMLKQ